MTAPEETADPVYPPLDPLRTGLRGRCPRCGKGRLFKGFLSLRPSCENCGLSYAFADPADGPAFIVICFGCVPAVAVALGIQIAYSPPAWVHLVTSLPFLLITCLLPLRPLKGWFTCTQYFYKAREGRLSGEWRPLRGDHDALHDAQYQAEIYRLVQSELIGREAT